jgi:hypothetical protein
MSVADRGLSRDRFISKPRNRMRQLAGCDIPRKFSANRSRGGNGMSRTVVMFLYLGGMAVLADAQVSSPEFEVASVKPAGPVVPSGRLPPGQ